MYAAALIARLLKTLQQSLYIYPGGVVAPIMHECQAAGVPLICGKSEQGAGFMAIAESILSGKPSFVAVTSGPGATNLVTCIAEAYFDSHPLICITGQVGVRDLERSPTLRQRGFQEMSVVEVVRPITKAVYQPRSAGQVGEMLSMAWRQAQEGRPGPVLIDWPMNVQLEELAPSVVEKYELPSSQKKSAVLNGEQLAQIRAAFLDAARPLILVGGGARGAISALRELVSAWGVPVVSSMRGLGLVAASDPCWQGWIGHTGMPWANWALAAADVVLVLGSRLDLRQTGTQTASFDGKTLIHVDVDEQELAHCRVRQTLALPMSVENFLTAMLQDGSSGAPALPNWSGWREELANKRQEMSLSDHGSEPGAAPDALLKLVDKLSERGKRAVVTGVGSHQQWAARYFSADWPRKLLLTSAGHGTMGFALPVALGVKRLEPDRLVVAVDGDGSLQINIQELALIKELGLNIKILVMDNQRLGIVSQFQQITFHSDPVTGDFRGPDFAALARAYGLAAWTIDQVDESMVSRWLAWPQAALLHARIQHDAPVSPMLLAGQTLDSMWRHGQG